MVAVSLEEVSRLFRDRCCLPRDFAVLDCLGVLPEYLRLRPSRFHGRLLEKLGNADSSLLFMNLIDSVDDDSNSPAVSTFADFGYGSAALDSGVPVYDSLVLYYGCFRYPCPFVVFDRSYGEQYWDVLRDVTVDSLDSLQYPVAFGSGAFVEQLYSISIEDLKKVLQGNGVQRVRTRGLYMHIPLYVYGLPFLLLNGFRSLDVGSALFSDLFYRLFVSLEGDSSFDHWTCPAKDILTYSLSQPELVSVDDFVPEHASELKRLSTLLRGKSGKGDTVVLLDFGDGFASIFVVNSTVLSSGLLASYFARYRVYRASVWALDIAHRDVDGLEDVAMYMLHPLWSILRGSRMLPVRWKRYLNGGAVFQYEDLGDDPGAWWDLWFLQWWNYFPYGSVGKLGSVSLSLLVNGSFMSYRQVMHDWGRGSVYLRDFGRSFVRRLCRAHYSYYGHNYVYASDVVDSSGMGTVDPCGQWVDLAMNGRLSKITYRMSSGSLRSWDLLSGL